MGTRDWRVRRTAFGEGEKSPPQPTDAKSHPTKETEAEATIAYITPDSAH